jgi:L-threonylcarbamoyladenylate synthase
MVRVVRATQVEIDTAVQALRDGELVAFPTETVYGLGANAQNPAAVRKIFAAKGRPADHPVIVHLDSPRFLHRWVREVPEAANKLAERFWPGPLTMVMPRAANVHDVVTGGQDTVAIRVPSHPMAQQLLTAFGGGIAAPSANRYGRLSPTRADHVRDELGDAVNTILDGGETQIGLESTILTFEGANVRLLRPGAVTAGQIRTVIGDELLIGANTESPRVRGGWRDRCARRFALRGRPPNRSARTTAATEIPQVRHVDQRRTPSGAVWTRPLRESAYAG